MINGKLKRLFIVTDSFFPHDYSTAWFINRIAARLSQDFEVHVITATSSENTNPKDFDISRVNVHRVGVSNKYSYSIPLRLIASLRVATSLAKELKTNITAGDLVFVTTNPPMLPSAILKVCFEARVPCVLNVQDLYPDALAAARFLSRSGLPFKYLEWKSTRELKMFTVITADGRDALEVIDRRLGSTKVPLFFTPHWADTDAISPMNKSKSTMIQSLGWQNEFVIQLTGNLGRLQDNEIAFRLLKHFHGVNGIKWILSERLLTAIRPSDSEWVIKNPDIKLVPFQKREQMSDLLAASDLHMILMRRGTFGVSSTSRVYNILASARPVLAAAEPNSELEQVIRETNSGMVVDPANLEALITAIVELRVTPNKLEQWANNGLKSAIDKFNEGNCIEKYNDIIMSL